MFRLFAVAATILIAGCATRLPTSSDMRVLKTGESVGYATAFRYCTKNPEACDRSGDPVVELTPGRWRVMGYVQARGNEWSGRDDLPGKDEWIDTGGGDCEDFALHKRRKLIEYGFPGNALSIARGYDVPKRPGPARRQGHVVLVAHTDRGDFILDNLRDRVVAWYEACYVWRSIQTPGAFVKFDRTRSTNNATREFCTPYQRTRLPEIATLVSARRTTVRNR